MSSKESKTPTKATNDKAGSKKPTKTESPVSAATSSEGRKSTSSVANQSMDKSPKGDTSKPSSFPLTRIRMIMKSTPDVTALGVDAVALTARAAELFIIFLAQEALKLPENKKSGKKQIEYEDIHKVVHDRQTLDFLHDIIPEKISFKEFLVELEEYKKEEQNWLNIEI